MERSLELEMRNCIHGEPTGNNYIFRSILYFMYHVSNAALGLGDTDDRTYPELVHSKPKEDSATLAKMDISFRFSSLFVRQIRMSRLHTVIITNESQGNVRLCGFGSGGR